MPYNKSFISRLWYFLRISRCSETQRWHHLEAPTSGPSAGVTIFPYSSCIIEDSILALLHFFLPLILAQISTVRSGCCNWNSFDLFAVLIILLHSMAEALNESQDKYFSNNTYILILNLCTLIPEVIWCNDVPHQDCIYMHKHGKSHFNHSAYNTHIQLEM